MTRIPVSGKSAGKMIRSTPTGTDASARSNHVLLRIRQAARLPPLPIGRIYPEGNGGLEHMSVCPITQTYFFVCIIVYFTQIVKLFTM